MRIQTILVGMDWSAAAMDAWREACLVASTFGAQVVLVHAIGDGADDLAAQEREQATLRAEELLRDMSLGESARPRVVVQAGRPADVLLAAAKEQEADLIVIGAGQRTALDRLLLGSAAERVVRESPAPVWLVRPGRAHQQVRKVLVALDGDPTSSMAAESTAALRAGVFLCRTFVADLTVVTVVADEEQLDAGEAALRRELAAIDRHGLRTEVVVRSGKPAVGIVDAADEAGCDLLVMGTRGRTGLAHLWTGSTAERVIRAMPSSALVVKAG